MVATSPQRFWKLDAARGGAVVAMVSYHFFFILMYIGWWEWQILHPLWKATSLLIYGTFLTLVGISLVIWFEKNRKKTDRRSLVWALLRKSLPIFGAAGLVTLATYLTVPQDTVWFGVLHLIAVANLLSYPWLKFKLNVWPWIGALVGGGWLLSSMSWPTWWLLPVGFVPAGFRSLDYFPIFPKFAFVLLGIEVGRQIMAGRLRFLVGSPNKPCVWQRSLVWMGRHALGIYLCHVPLILLMIWLLARSWELELVLP